MNDINELITHLLTTQFSIDRVDTIVNKLNISKNQLFQLINDEQFRDFFQLLHPSNDQNHGFEKIALTLDLFCCTHYANNCKNQACPFLHLCPYNFRPMQTKCSNKNCPFDHDVFQSLHNRRIIDARDLSFIPVRTLHELIRASADENRSLWVCHDYGRKNGCSNRSQCNKLHYCYYALTDSCTKSRCPHEINKDCLSYFRNKELNEQEHDDILQAFRKVLRQRKPDYTNTIGKPHHPSSASSSPKVSNSGNHQGKLSANHSHRPTSSSRRTKSTPKEATISPYDDITSSQTDPPSPMSEHDQDILLIDHRDNHEYQYNERHLSDQIGCPIKLLISKEINSKYKDNQNSKLALKPVYYYCPVKNPADIFDLLHWQNQENQPIEPLIAYASIRDAHDAAKQNFENNQFCIVRIHLFHTGIINGDLLPENRLQLNNSSTMRFDRMWVYVYNF